METRKRRNERREKRRGEEGRRRRVNWQGEEMHGKERRGGLGKREDRRRSGLERRGGEAGRGREYSKAFQCSTAVKAGKLASGLQHQHYRNNCQKASVLYIIALLWRYINRFTDTETAVSLSISVHQIRARSKV